MSRERRERVERLIVFVSEPQCAPTTADERRELLEEVVGENWTRLGHKRIADLQAWVRWARSEGAKALRSREQGSEEGERRHFLLAAAVLRPLTKRLGFDLQTEETLVPSSRSPLITRSVVLSGVTERYQPPNHRWRSLLKVPPALGPIALDPKSAIGLAALEQLVNAKSYGQCPFCHEWWLSNERRHHRLTCGAPDCDNARKRISQKRNPEPAERVAGRVQRHRDKAQKTRRRGSVRARGVTSVKARTR
ncbi:MAG TPA: hypothetical protein VHG53_02160 [Candidatus Limnocylindria bacterium]|nr:hypothetical protein [Candidatus Limnocylindria bacterium]